MDYSNQKKLKKLKVIKSQNSDQYKPLKASEIKTLAKFIDNDDLLYKVTMKLHRDGYSKTLKFLKDLKKHKELENFEILDSNMENNRQEVDEIIKNQMKKVDFLETDAQCPHCHSKRATGVFVQRSSGDEAMSYYITCLEPGCKKTAWR